VQENFLILLNGKGEEVESRNSFEALLPIEKNYQ